MGAYMVFNGKGELMAACDTRARAEAFIVRYGFADWYIEEGTFE